MCILVKIIILESNTMFLISKMLYFDLFSDTAFL